MKLLFTFCALFISSATLAQAPPPAFHPMTANGARHITIYNNSNFAFKLFWENSPEADYNDVYFSQDSNLVISLDPAALIISGYDSLEVIDSLSLALIGVLELHTKYYWRVVEHNSSGYTPGPVWYFITEGIYSYWEDYFDSGLSNYTLINQEYSYWDISNSNNAGRQPPELEFADYGSWGTSYLILNDFFDLSPELNYISFNYSFELFSGSFTIGMVYSLDEGSTWIPLWQQEITGNIPADEIYFQSPNENYVKLALFCTNNSVSFCNWYVDNLLLNSPLTLPAPPGQIRARASHDFQKVSLHWIPGFTVDPSAGYRIQRKSGLPQSDSSYQTIAEVGPTVLSFEDTLVQLNQTYTYRIAELSWPSNYSTVWSNEATAYVPPVTPVELQNFYAEISGNDIQLLWTTATETNNQGFEIQRKQRSGNSEHAGWMKIGFAEGNGTTTEIHNYIYIDKNPGKGKFQYRLKQIDLDGNFKYSRITDASIGLPDKFYLSQNYPNPFNPSTRIEYQIPAATKIRLTVYDMLGREIKILVDEIKSAGTYEATFSGDNLPSGIYIYKLTAGTYSAAGKMMLVK